MNTVCINNQPLEVKEWNGRRVVSFKDIDRVHQRKEGTAKRGFQTNKKHFVENEDYFLAKPDVDKKYEKRTFSIPVRGLTLLTETGYLMLVKSLTDDLAWKVQRELVNSYFRAPQQPAPVQQTLPPARKFYNGMPVMTNKDVADMIGCHPHKINWYHESKRIGTVLTGDTMAKYKKENGLKNDSTAKLLIYYESEVMLILHFLGCSDAHRDFMAEYFKPKHNTSLANQDMAVAVQQATLLYKIAIEIKDPVVKEMNLKAVTALLMSVGLWNEDHYGFNGVTAEWSQHTPEGWNKNAVLLDARRHFPYKA